MPAAANAIVMPNIPPTCSQNAQSPTFDSRSDSVVPGHRRQRIGDHREHDHHIGAEERRVAVHRRDQRAVGPFVDRRPGVREAEQAGAERREDGATERPVKRQRVRMRHARAPDGGVRVDRHAQEDQRLERREEPADRQPVLRHADPVVMVRGAEEAGDEGQARRSRRATSPSPRGRSPDSLISR